MNLDAFNNIAYKVACMAIMLLLLFGGIGFIVEQRLYVRGGIGIAASVIAGLKIRQPASVKTWLYLLIVFVAAMMLVGAVKTF